MILVFDRDGAIFSTLRELELGLPLWRVTDPSRLEKIDRIELAIVAVYEDVPWDLVATAERPFDTLVLTKRYDEDEALDALGRGLIGYIDASMAAEAVRTAILSCLQGEPGYRPGVLGRWLHAQNTCVRAHCNVTRLTDRQREVLDLIAEGLADKEIAERLGIATATAQKHVTNILERLHVANRAAAAAAVCRLVTHAASRAVSTPRLPNIALPTLLAAS